MDEIVIFTRGLDGSAKFYVGVKGKRTILAEGSKEKISGYIFLNHPEIARRFLSFKEFGNPYPQELSDVDSTPRAELIDLVVKEFSK